MWYIVIAINSVKKNLIFFSHMKVLFHTLVYNNIFSKLTYHEVKLPLITSFYEFNNKV